MIRIIITLFAFASVQLVSSQLDDCTQAVTAFSTDATCSTAITTPDTDTLCMGNCRTLLDDILSNCDETTGVAYYTVFNTYCSPCGMATFTLAANTNCTSGVADVNVLCNDPCRTLFDNFISNCNDSTAAGYSTAISTLCGGGNTGDPCLDAISTAQSSAACLSAPDAICTGECRSLYDDILDNCDEATAASYQTALSTVCGGGDACTTAITALTTSLGCASTTDPDTLCTGECRNLLDAIIDNCNESSADTYQNAIDLYCDGGTTTTNPADPACQAAVLAVSSTCDYLLYYADPSLCTTCQSDLAAVTSACRSASADYRGFSYAYETACSSGEECTAALTALNANTTCINAFDNDQTEISCGETCLSFSNAAFSACPNNAFITSNRNGLYEDCGINTGGGGDGGALIMKASGIVTLLFVAVFAVIF